MRSMLSTIRERLLSGALSRRLARNAGYNLGGWLVVLAANLATLPYLVEGLGPDAYGVFVIITSVVSYLGLLELGLGAAVVKYVAEFYATGDVEGINRAVGTITVVQSVLGALAGVVVFLCAEPLSRLFFSPEGQLYSSTVVCFRLSAVGIVATLAVSPLTGVIQGMQRYDLHNIVTAVQGIANPVLSVFLVYLGRGIEELVLLSVVLVSASGVVNYLLVRKILPAFRYALARRFTDFRGILSFGLYTLMGRVSYLFNTQLIRFFIGIVLGTAQVTYFTVASKLAVALAGVFSTSVSVLFPAVSEISALKQVERTRSVLRKGMVLVSASAILPFALLLAFSHLILKLWMGPAVAAEAATVQSILALAHYLYVLGMVPNTVALGCGYSKLVGYVSLLTSLAIGISIYPFMVLWGVNGAGVSVLLGAVAGLLTLVQLHRYLRRDAGA